MARFLSRMVRNTGNLRRRLDAFLLPQSFDTAGEHRRPLGDVVLVLYIRCWRAKYGARRLLAEECVDSDGGDHFGVLLADFWRPPFDPVGDFGGEAVD